MLVHKVKETSPGGYPFRSDAYMKRVCHMCPVESPKLVESEHPLIRRIIGPKWESRLDG